MCFFKKSLSTKKAYAYFERFVILWRGAGIPISQERTEDNYKVLPCTEMTKQFCSFCFLTKMDGLELLFRVRYSKLNQQLYLYVEFKNLEFYRLAETQERLKKEYYGEGEHHFTFTFKPSSTEVCYAEWFNITCEDDLIRLCQNYIDAWKASGIYEEMLDYYRLFK